MKHPCTLCEASFARPSKLTIHIRKVHMKETLFQCHVCNKDYSQAAHLKRHVENCHEKNLSKTTKRPSYKCGVSGCFKVFYTEFGLTRHLNGHFGFRKFRCPSCAESFKTKNLLDRHLFTHTGKVPYQCEICSAKFFELHLFNKHKRQSHASKVYVCHHPDCDSVQFDNISAYRKHESEHNKQRFTCAICHRKFQRKMHLAEHILAAHETNYQTFACPFDGCDKVYAFQRNITAHIKSRHSKVQHACPHPGCHQTLSTRQKLQHHLKLHEKPEVGTAKNAEKGRTAVTLITSVSQDEKTILIENLKNREFVVTNDDSSLDRSEETVQPSDFKCSVGGCTKSFPTKFGLVVHLRVHFNEGKYKCPFCPQIFRAKSKLDKHTFTHTGKMPYECELCPAKFFDRSAFKRHKFEVHDQKKFSCDACGARFSRKMPLREHILSFHEFSGQRNSEHPLENASSEQKSKISSPELS